MLKKFVLQMTNEQICERALKEGFARVIEITENDEGDIVNITHEPLMFLPEKTEK